MLKKILIITNKYREADKEELSMRINNVVLSDSASIIDLPPQAAEALISNDKIIFKSISWCMFPIIWAGDTLKIEPIKQEDAKKGDIILYKSAGFAFAHRLVKTYIGEKDGLYIVTSGEREFRNNQFNDYTNYTGVSFDNVLGRVIEIKRGRLCFRPDEADQSLISLIQGRLKLSLWILMRKIKQYKQYIAKIFIRLQRVKLYRYCLRTSIRDKVSFFVGTPLLKNKGEINSFCFYQAFEDFSKDFANSEGLYNISARINNKPVGNIGLFLERIDNRKVCTLSNFIVRILYRSIGIGCQLLRKALYLCDKINVEEIRISLSEEDKIAVELFKKLDFSISK